MGLRALLAATAAALLAAPAAGAVSGEQRLLVLLLGSARPVTAAQARTVLDDASAYERRVSYGTTWLSGDVLDAVPMPRGAACDLAAIEAAGRSGAAAAHVNAAGYTHLVFVFPQNDCPWGGAYFDGHVWANGYFVDQLLEHELGHLFGVQEEGPAWLCDAGACRAQNYASPYSVMGHGAADYSAFEKWIYGWLQPVNAVAPATYTLDAYERHPSALRVLTAGDDYWFEYRAEKAPWSPAPWLFGFDLEPAAGVVVHAGTSGVGRSTFPSRDLYVPANGHAALQAGETFSVVGAFSLSVVSAAGEHASVAFRWTDTTAPAAPRLVNAYRDLRWTAARETGSGVRSYVVTLDGRTLRTLDAVRDYGTSLGEVNRELRLPRLAHGTHRVSVVAVDRAGNRGTAATRSFRVR
jgi:hypothetical protein